MYKVAESIQRITANIPKKLLKEAQDVTKGGITETLVEGLRLVKRRKAFQKGMALKGKIHLSIDIDQARERNHC